MTLMMTMMTIHQTWLTPDRLEGDNKYFCSRCNSKQDALRIPVPTAMPPVINMHLARYEYDPITYQKKKVSDRGRGVEHTYSCMSSTGRCTSWTVLSHQAHLLPLPALAMPADQGPHLLGRADQLQRPPPHRTAPAGSTT